jgi:hypothetical protein
MEYVSVVGWDLKSELTEEYDAIVPLHETVADLFSITCIQLL